MEKFHLAVNNNKCVDYCARKRCNSYIIVFCKMSLFYYRIAYSNSFEFINFIKSVRIIYGLCLVT